MTLDPVRVLTMAALALFWVGVFVAVHLARVHR